MGALRIQLPAGILCLWVCAASAQLVSDGATNVLSGTTNIVSGSLTVGTNGSQTALIITNGGLVSVSIHGVISRFTGSFSNTVSVSGAGSQWLVSRDVFVGSNGWGNRLFIEDGARVANQLGHIGYENLSSNNEVVVRGGTTIWTNEGTLTVGRDSSGNRLVISDGATVASHNGSIGSRTNAANNLVPSRVWGRSGAMATFCRWGRGSMHRGTS